MAEDVRTDESRLASLRLGVLLSKAGEHSEAEKSLKEAVALNAGDSRRRAEAYLWLAKNCEAASDFRGACGYATVLVSLFEGDEAAEEAKKMLAAHPEEAR
jgi:tetratricopeptide (TPR) repeat protein